MTGILLLLSTAVLPMAHAEEIASWDLEEDDGGFFAADGGLQWAWDTIKGPPLEDATSVAGWSSPRTRACS